MELLFARSVHRLVATSKSTTPSDALQKAPEQFIVFFHERLASIYNLVPPAMLKSVLALYMSCATGRRYIKIFTTTYIYAPEIGYLASHVVYETTPPN